MIAICPKGHSIITNHKRQAPVTRRKSSMGNKRIRCTRCKRSYHKDEVEFRGLQPPAVGNAPGYFDMIDQRDIDQLKEIREYETISGTEQEGLLLKVPQV